MIALTGLAGEVTTDPPAAAITVGRYINGHEPAGVLLPDHDLARRTLRLVSPFDGYTTVGP